MYKCSECEKIFDIKPDYCDCGNDTFIEITEEKPKATPKAKTPKKSFEELYPGFASFKNSLDPLSVIIFCVCIILSILSLIFIGRGDGVAEEQKEEIAIIKKVNTNIDSFWDNSLPKKEEVIVKKEEVQTPVIKKTEPPKTVTAKIVLNAQTKPKTEVKVQTQKTTQTKQQTTSTKSQQTAQPKPSQKVQTKPSQTTQTKPQQTTNTQIKTQRIEVSTPTTQTTQNSKINTSQTSQKPTQAELQELRNYKNSLRNLIFSYIDFTSIVGDGVCTVTFTINESGQLKNKVFAQRSASTMLNDAVFYAAKKVTSFKQPPSAYKGETLKFTVQFVAGQYEVSLN